MKGVVFNLLEEAVAREHGEDTWDALLEAAGLEGAYTSLGSYPDEDLMGLVGAASSALGIPPDDVVRWFGRSAIPLLADRYPDFFAPHESTRSFVLTLNSIIHPEVRKLYPGADVPVFDYETSSEDRLVMGYASARKLCSFAEGLVEGAAAHYEEEAVIEQPRCMKRGDEKCVLEISFHTQDGNGAQRAAVPGG
jgi:heme-NO-binding protein